MVIIHRIKTRHYNALSQTSDNPLGKLEKNIHTVQTSEFCRNAYFVSKVYLCQIDKFGEDILNHSRAITSGRFSVWQSWRWTLTLTSQDSICLEVENRCNFHSKNGDTNFPHLPLTLPVHLSLPPRPLSSVRLRVTMTSFLYKSLDKISTHDNEVIDTVPHAARCSYGCPLHDTPRIIDIVPHAARCSYGCPLHDTPRVFYTFESRM